MHFTCFYMVLSIFFRWNKHRFRKRTTFPPAGGGKVAGYQRYISSIYSVFKVEGRKVAMSHRVFSLFLVTWGVLREEGGGRQISQPMV